MNKTNNIFVLLLVLLCFSCSNNSTSPDENNADSTAVVKKVDTLELFIKDSLPDSSIVETTTNRDNWTLNDYIQPPYRQNPGLRNETKWLIEEWSAVPNPFTAAYKGNDFGDYHHVFFEDQHGRTYDFGQANNDFGKYELFDSSGQYEDNPVYLGKTFTVYWDWKLATFPCCEGEYKMVEAYVPTITRLELVEAAK